MKIRELTTEDVTFSTDLRPGNMDCDTDEPGVHPIDVMLVLDENPQTLWRISVLARWQEALGTEEYFGVALPLGLSVEELNAWVEGRIIEHKLREGALKNLNQGLADLIKMLGLLAVETEDRCTAAIAEIREVLRPGGDTEAEWDSSTADAIEKVLHQYGLTEPTTNDSDTLN